MTKSKENRRVVRLKLAEPMSVLIGSIGSDVRYELITRNISYNGFFLDFEKPGRFPFTAASIMEIWLELEPEKSIFFNGKMTRVVYPADTAAEDEGPGIAVRIVQISSDNEEVLRKYIDTNMPESNEKDEIVA